MHLPLPELPAIVGGEWLLPPSPAHAADAITAICDDTRKLAPGALFPAIKGELTDGHQYIVAAAKAGASVVLVQERPESEPLRQLQELSCPCLLVPDTLKAFQQLALWHRRCFPQARVLAITGSCGKTSTKEMCAAILEQRWPGGILKTIGSTNNHFGVPRNLLRMDETTRVAVIEMGTNHPGEIANLVSLAPPDVGLVCNIGHAHLEFFHDLRGVANEKGDLLQGTLADGLCIYPADAEGADILRAKAGKRRCLSFGHAPEAALSFDYLGYDGSAFAVRLHWKDSGETRLVRWQLGGFHMASNAAAAAAAATALGCTPDECVAGLQGCRLPGQRLELRAVDGITWVNDAFNANPDSTKAALDWLREIAPANAPKLLVLGDMLELGKDSDAQHRDIIAYAQKTLPDAEILTVGTCMKTAAAQLPEGHLACVEKAEDARPWLAQHAAPGTWVLLKGSHGIRLSLLFPTGDNGK